MDLLLQQSIDTFFSLVTLGWLGVASFGLMVAVNGFKMALPGLWAKLPRWAQTAVPLVFAVAGVGVGLYAGGAAQTLVPFAVASAGLSFINHKVAKSIAVALDRRFGSGGSESYQPSRISRGLSLVGHVSVDGAGNLKPPAVGTAKMGR